MEVMTTEIELHPEIAQQIEALARRSGVPARVLVHSMLYELLKEFEEQGTEEIRVRIIWWLPDEDMPLRIAELAREWGCSTEDAAKALIALGLRYLDLARELSDTAADVRAATIAASCAAREGECEPITPAQAQKVRERAIERAKKLASALQKSQKNKRKK